MEKASFLVVIGNALVWFAGAFFMVAIHPAPPAVSAFPASFQTETRDMLYRSTATGCAYRAALLAGGSS